MASSLVIESASRAGILSSADNDTTYVAGLPERSVTYSLPEPLLNVRREGLNHSSIRVAAPAVDTCVGLGRGQGTHFDGSSRSRVMVIPELCAPPPTLICILSPTFCHSHVVLCGSSSSSHQGTPSRSWCSGSCLRSVATSSG